MERVVTEADGYQPHLIAPEQGYRRLIEGSIGYFKGPAEASVDAVILFTLFLHLFKYVMDLKCSCAVKDILLLKELFISL